MPPKKKRKAPAAAGLKVWKVTGAELVKAFEHLIYSLPACHDRWFRDADWCSILPTYWSSLRNYKDQVTPKMFSRAIKSHFGEVSGDRGEINPNGVYAVQHSTKTWTSWCFMITKRAICPLPPSSPHFSVSSITEVLEPALPTYRPVALKAAEKIANESYCDSTEAWKQFMPSDSPYPKKSNESTSEQVKEAIEKRMEACQSGIKHFWKVIEDGKEDDINEVTADKKKKLTIQCHTIYAVLKRVKETMDDNQTQFNFKHCCNYAIDVMKYVGFEEMAKAETVARWHTLMRDKHNKFPHPNENARKKKAAMEEAEKDEAELELEESGEEDSVA